MPQLKLFLLGAPRIEVDGQPVHVETRKGVALLAFLCLTGESHRRDALVNLLWPEYNLVHGRAVLRRTLSALRKALGSGWLETDRDTIGLGSGAGVWLDVAEFRRRLAECDQHGHPANQVCPICQVALAEAIALYRDDLLSGFSLGDSFNFDDWQFFQAETLRGELAIALAKQVRCCIAQGKLEDALGYARRWLALDRLNELAHRQLMLLYAGTGQRTAALRQYQECKEILHSQLKAEPQQETTQLYLAIETYHIPSVPKGQRGEEPDSPGVAAAPPAPAVGAALQAPATPGEEIRLVTVVCIELLATPALPGTRHAEAQVNTATRFLDLLDPILEQYGGRIERWLGRSVLAVFGAAQTRENDPELAARAALEVRSTASRSGFAVALGVHTGEVNFWRGGPDAAGLLGEAVELAMELANQAQAGEILVSHTTYHLIWSTFAFTQVTYESRVTHSPVPVYHLGRLLPGSRKVHGAETLYAPLVGREDPLRKLVAALESVQAGEGQVVILSGEVGVGKSRLVEELKTIVFSPDTGRSGLEWLEGRCLELGIEVSYWPFLDMLKEFLAWRSGDDDQKHRDQIAAVLQELVEAGALPGERGPEIELLLGRLLSVPVGEEREDPLANAPPPLIRQKTFTAVQELLLALAKRQSLVLVFEDLHWADRLSLDLIAALMEVIHQAPMLLLCVYRPGQEYPTRNLAMLADQKCRDRTTELPLRALTPSESQRMVDALLGENQLSKFAYNLIWERTGGNPFFIEAIIQAMIDNGMIFQDGDVWRTQASFPYSQVPASVQGMILSRLEHLPDDQKQVLQIAAVIGHVFRRMYLEQIAPPGTNPAQALWELEGHGLIYRQRAIPEDEFAFSHVLIQEAVYQNLARQERQEYHRRVAEAIEQRYPDSLDELVEQLAYHYEKSGDLEKTLIYLLKAGEKARENYANEAAIACLEKGLALLHSLPEAPARDCLELDYLDSLGVSLVRGRGHSFPEVGALYTRARELCLKTGDTTRLFPALVGLRRYHFWHGNVPLACDLDRQLLELARRNQDPIELARAHQTAVETLYWLGEFDQVVEHCQEGLAIYRPEHLQAHILRYGSDSGLGFQVWESLATWQLGFPDQTRRLTQAVLARGEKISHPFSYGFALSFSAYAYIFLREPARVQQLSEKQLAIANEKGYALYQAWGAVKLGWALAVQGQVSEGLGQLRQGIAESERQGLVIMLPDSYALLGEALGRAGKAAEALDAVKKGLDLIAQTGARCWEAELLRLKGEMLQQVQRVRNSKKNRHEAELNFQQALDIARRQKARSWELRAATSLGLLWLEQGRAEAACRLLQEIYGWFTEGFQTPDLVDARMLLDKLER